MRILHTSDWHLGRSFGPVSLHAEQEAFLDWLVALVVDESVDLVVVSGDLYDRAIPPTDSVALLRETLDRLVDRAVRVVAIAGNHDGPERLAAYDGLTDRAGVIVRGGFARAGAVTTLELPDGPLDVVAVPYLDPVLTPPGWDDGAAAAAAPPVVIPDRPVAVPVERPVESPPDPDAPLSLFDLLVDDPEPVLVEADGVAAAGPPAVSGRRTHHGVLDHALGRARSARRAPRSLVVAHAFVSGAETSESERFLTVGGTAEVGGELFEGFDYVALGHLHRPQRVRAGDDTIRYPGTPLPYSFSETHPKQVLLVDMAPDGWCDVREVAVPLGRRVATVTGTVEALLADPDHEAATDCFVRAVVTDQGYVVDAKSRLQARFPHVVEIVPQPARGGPAGDEVVDHTVRRALPPLAAAIGFWRDVTGEEPEEVERSLLESALAHVASAEVQR